MKINGIKTDLHMHSTYSSDGQHSVSELIEFVKDANVDLFSITDHNNFEAANEVVNEFSISNNFVKNALNFISGIEFSTYFKGNEIHLLAYGLSLQSDNVYKIIDEFKKNRLKQTELRVYNLKKLGFDIEFEDIIKESGGKTASGVTFLKVLKKKEKNLPMLHEYLHGDKSDSPYTKFYFDYFFKGGLAYVDISLLNYKDVVNRLKNESVLVIAHPGLYPKDVLAHLIIDGIDGIEVYSTYHNNNQIEFFKQTAENLDLIMTSGSDFHGEDIKPGIKIGQTLSMNRNSLINFFDRLESKGCNLFFKKFY